MKTSTAHYVLYSAPDGDSESRRWRFQLRTADGAPKIEAEDVEPNLSGERLQLLAVVRGLEALDEPSRVTLMTPSCYVREGIRYGLPEWRKNGWRWECFGQMVPIKNGDLWRRVDTAMQYHQVECRTWRIDRPQAAVPPPKRSSSMQLRRAILPTGAHPRAGVEWAEPAIVFGRWAMGRLRAVTRWLARLPATLAHSPRIG